MTFQEWWASNGTFDKADAARCLELWNAAVADREERIRQRDGEWVDAIEDTLHFGIIPETLAGAIECMKAWLEEKEARIERVKGLHAAWKDAATKLVDGVKDSPSHDLKRMIKERAEAVNICADELLAALDGETKVGT